MAARSFGPADRGIPGVHRFAGPAADPHAPLKHSLRPRLTAIAPSIVEVVRCAGGWLFDQVLAGWDVTVLTADNADARPLRILGARARDLDAMLASPVWGPCLQAIAVPADLYASDARVRQMVHRALDAGPVEIRLWGEGWPADLDSPADPVRHRLSVAARAFKAQALAAAAVPADPGADTEVFRGAHRRQCLVSAQ